MTVRFLEYKRKRQGRTNYRKRLTLLVSGSPRLVIRKTNKNIVVQIVKYNEDGDNVVVTSTSAKLGKFGWNYAKGNMPAAYLAGLVAGKQALAKGVDNAIVDLGLQTPSKGSRLYAAVKGVLDAGVKVPCSKEALPSDERLRGLHISSYKEGNFKTSPANLDKDFEAVKKKILGS